ncbi:hypothetical protein [Xanthobacter agilis]|uniref:hypothetical protein n=1 Tax=Xanthobacter agilis TaxID=47492 RepID=UPI00372B743C
MPDTTEADIEELDVSDTEYVKELYKLHKDAWKSIADMDESSVPSDDDIQYMRHHFAISEQINYKYASFHNEPIDDELDIPERPDYKYTPFARIPIEESKIDLLRRLDDFLRANYPHIIAE